MLWKCKVSFKLNHCLSFQYRGNEVKTPNVPPLTQALWYVRAPSTTQTELGEKMGSKYKYDELGSPTNEILPTQPETWEL